MQVPAGAESFTFPNPRPSSPPATPGSSNSRQSSNASQTTSPLLNKRHGFIGLTYSPPEHLEPKGLGYQFSYTPPQRNLSSESSSQDSEATEESDDEDSDSEDSEPEVESLSATSEPPRRAPSVHVRPIDEEKDFTVEEVSDNDIGYDDHEVVRPDHCEDAESEKGCPESDRPESDRPESVEVNHDLADKLRELCTDNPKAKEFDDAQVYRYLSKKKRWSKGGSHKRSHAESVGSQSEDDDDIEPLEAQQLGSSARRLRRRTQGPEDRPRTSLLFDDPPREIEELKYLDDNPGEPPPLPESASDDSDDEHSSCDDEDEEDEDDEDEGIHVSEMPEDHVSLPYWLYRMETESASSRPSTASGSVAARHVPR
jgi:hypothetical protein